LTELNISDTDVMSPGFEHLSALSSLRRLWANGLKIHNDVGSLLFSLCFVLSMFKSLHVHDRQALRALRGMPDLVELHIDGPNLSDEGTPHIAALRGLQVLSMFDVRLSDAGLATLVCAKQPFCFPFSA
jgi:hypothetical protein